MDLYFGEQYYQMKILAWSWISQYLGTVMLLYGVVPNAVPKTIVREWTSVKKWVNVDFGKQVLQRT